MTRHKLTLRVNVGRAPANRDRLTRLAAAQLRRRADEVELEGYSLVGSAGADERVFEVTAVTK